MNASAEPLVFEHPLNERVRTQLRLEFIHRNIQHALTSGSVFDHRQALFLILDTLAIMNRGDVRAEVRKELERIHASLLPLKQVTHVNQNQLQQALDQIDYYLEAMIEERHHAADLKEVAFLNTIKQRSGLPGGACEFDLPSLHAWLSQPVAYRQDDIEHWLESFTALHGAINLCLHLMRVSADVLEVNCKDGVYHHSFSAERECQLVRIMLEPGQHIYPVVSGNRHGLSLRMMRQQDLRMKDEAASQEVAIKLACSYL